MPATRPRPRRTPNKRCPLGSLVATVKGIPGGVHLAGLVSLIAFPGIPDDDDDEGEPGTTCSSPRSSPSHHAALVTARVLCLWAWGAWIGKMVAGCIIVGIC